MAIEKHELLPLLVGCCPGLRDRLVDSISAWLHEDGSISYFQVVSQLARLMAEQFGSGNYDCADGLFGLVERLLAEGSQEVQEITATGFLEALLHQQQLPAEDWVPLVGPQARVYLRALDRFHGTLTPGLEGQT